MPDTSKFALNLQNADVIYMFAAVDRDSGQLNHVFIRPYADPTHHGDNWAFLKISEFHPVCGMTALETLLASFRPSPWLDWTFKFMGADLRSKLGVATLDKGLKDVGKEYADVSTWEGDNA